MRVWVTGVNGFSGKYFVSHLRSMPDAIEVIGFDIAVSSDIDVDHYESISITDTESIVRLARKYPPTHVLHCAASVFESDVNLLWQSNVRGTAVLIDSLRIAGLRDVRVLCIGSAAEYARCDTSEISETNSVSPSSEYGKSKLAQSLLALSLGSAMGQSVTVARTFNLIGPGTSVNLVPGAILKRLTDNVGGAITVSDAYSSRDFIDVRDAVSAYWELMLRGKQSSIYNVCSGASTTIADLAGKLANSYAGEVRVEIDERDKSRSSHVLGCNEKIRKDVGWAPRISLDASVADMISAAAQ